MAVSDYSGTPADNTVISGLPVSDNTVVNTVDDIIRQLMADIKTVYDDTPLKSVAQTISQDYTFTAALNVSGAATFTGSHNINSGSASVTSLAGANGGNALQKISARRDGTTKGNAAITMEVPRGDTPDGSTVAQLMLIALGEDRKETPGNFPEAWLKVQSASLTADTDHTALKAGNSFGLRWLENALEAWEGGTRYLTIEASTTPSRDDTAMTRAMSDARYAGIDTVFQEADVSVNAGAEDPILENIPATAQEIVITGENITGPNANTSIYMRVGNLVAFTASDYINGTTGNTSFIQVFGNMSATDTHFRYTLRRMSETSDIWVFDGTGARQNSTQTNCGKLTQSDLRRIQVYGSDGTLTSHNIRVTYR